MKTEHFRCDEPGCEAHWNGWLGQLAMPPGWMILVANHHQEGDDGRLLMPLAPILYICPEHATALAIHYRSAPVPRPGHETP